MKIVCILLLPLLLLSGCQTEGKRIARAQTVAELDLMLEAMAPKSLQYAEQIGPEKYRIYNLFETHDGRLLDLGSRDFTHGEPVRAKGFPESDIDQITTEILQVRSDQLFLQSIFSKSDGTTSEASAWLPIRRSTTEPDDAENGGKPLGDERTP